MMLLSKFRKTSVTGIDFRSDHWFDEYIEYRKRHPLVLDIADPAAVGLAPEYLHRFKSLQHPLYFMLLHSGLIYGFPFVYPFQPAPASNMPRKWVTKLLLVDLILFSVLDHFKSSALDYEMQVDRAATLIRIYFSGLRQQSGGMSVGTIGRLLSEHISFRQNWVDWRRSGINCHLFWDWYFFQLYLEALDRDAQPSQDLFADMLQRKKQLKMLTMQLIAAAAHSDHKLDLSERVLQHHFQKSAPFFTDSERRKIKRNFDKGVELSDIHLPPLEWTARRYLLDISLMTLFADKEIQEAEELFLQQLLTKLELKEEDLVEAKLALGGFLLRYGRRLSFFNSQKASAALIAKTLGDNMLSLRTATHGEYRETVDMALTFGRLLKHQLGIRRGAKLPSEEEIAQALDQIQDLPRFLPFFSLVFVPVPGITEMYIMLAYSIEKLTKNNVRLLPSHFSKMVKKKKS